MKEISLQDNRPESWALLVIDGKEIPLARDDLEVLERLFDEARRRGLG